jgi:hypothetical protein
MILSLLIVTISYTHCSIDSSSLPPSAPENVYASDLVDMSHISSNISNSNHGEIGYKQYRILLSLSV